MDRGGRQPCHTGELATVPLFAGLRPAQLETLCALGHVELMGPGRLCSEGQLATGFYVLLDGEVVIGRRSGGEDREVERSSQRGLPFGATTARLDGSAGRYDCSVTLTRLSRLFVLAADDFGDFMRRECPIALHLFEGYLADRRQHHRALGQRERLLALGALTAGLNRQLDTPARTIAAAVADLRTTVGTSREVLASLVDGQFTSRALQVLVEFEDQVVDRVAKSHLQARQVDGQAYVAPLSASEAHRRAVEVERWVSQRGIAGPLRRGTDFADAGLDVTWLDHLEAALDAAGAEHRMAAVLVWLEQTVTTETRIQEIAAACERISALVAGAKLYAHLDRGEYQSADLHELLRGTLVMYGDSVAMPGKGRPVTLVKQLDLRIPDIHCYPAELNQVWTALIDNALAAIRGRGTLTVRTRAAGDSWVCVDIDDGGTDIPTDGGLGTAWRVVVEQHHGTLAARSRPGDARFSVCLPTRAPAPEATAGA